MQFEFATAGRVVLGPGRSSELAGLVAELGLRAMICTGSHPDRHAPLLESLTRPHVVWTVAGEPTVESAERPWPSVGSRAST